MIVIVGRKGGKEEAEIGPIAGFDCGALRTIYA